MLLGAPTAGLARGRISLIGLVRSTLDPVLIAACLYASCVATGSGFDGQELVLAVLAFALSFPSEVSLHRLRHNLFGTIVVNWLLLALLLLFFGYATRFIGGFDRAMLLAWLLATPLVLYAAHRIIPHLVPQLLAIDGCRSAVVVAANEVGRRLARQLVSEPALGFRFSGFFDDAALGAGADNQTPAPRWTPDADGPLLGPIDAAPAYIRRHAIETVFIALPMAAQPRLLALLDEIKDTTASVYFVPDIFITDLINARLDDINGMPVVAVCESPLVGVAALVKRGADLTLGSLTLALCAPIMALVAVAIRLDSPGPVLFRQHRYGLDGRQIVVSKFRTMTVAEDGEVVRQATRGDQRVTRIGAVLRRTSLDELPQLFNVLGGSMSLVGPRPHAVAHNEQYRRLIKGYMVRHKIKPGITGWAQVNGLRGETASVETMRARIEYDLEYLRRWSPGFDLLILLKTLLIVFRRTNAF